MTDDQLIQMLIEHKALIVHCSTPGKADVGADDLLFPDDLQTAIGICSEGNRELSCSLVWPCHDKTFGAIGIILKPRAIASITSISVHDSGTTPDADGKRQGMGVAFSVEALEDTIANSKDYNELTLKQADTIGIFLNLQEPLQIAKRVALIDVPGYEPSMGNMGSTIGPVSITIKEVMAAFPGLPLYGFKESQIVEISIDACTERLTKVEASAVYNTQVSR